MDYLLALTLYLMGMGTSPDNPPPQDPTTVNTNDGTVHPMGGGIPTKPPVSDPAS